jgi:hypothetical protein
VRTSGVERGRGGIPGKPLAERADAGPGGGGGRHAPARCDGGRIQRSGKTDHTRSAPRQVPPSLEVERGRGAGKNEDEAVPVDARSGCVRALRFSCVAVEGTGNRRPHGEEKAGECECGQRPEHPGDHELLLHRGGVVCFGGWGPAAASVPRPEAPGCRRLVISRRRSPAAPSATRSAPRPGAPRSPLRRAPPCSRRGARIPDPPRRAPSSGGFPRCPRGG